MNTDFPRIITLLRKEKGVNQKSAAESLGVSQSLLSHYEKGKRECGLDFVVKCANYYGVSSDYLLGLSAERNGAKISVDEIPDGELLGTGKSVKGSFYAVLNKKLIGNSITVIFDLLSKCGDSELIKDISQYLSLCVYDSFRVIYGSNKENEEKLFSISEKMYQALSDAKKLLLKSSAESRCESTNFNKDALKIDTNSLTEEYRSLAQSLFNVIQNAESELTKLKD